MKVDDSVLSQYGVLTCSPSAVDFDMDMKLGGNYIGEVDTLRINFRTYALHKEQAKGNVLVGRYGLPIKFCDQCFMF